VATSSSHGGGLLACRAAHLLAQGLGKGLHPERPVAVQRFVLVDDLAALHGGGLGVEAQRRVGQPLKHLVDQQRRTGELILDELVQQRMGGGCGHRCGGRP
jgi:hypothetical protein